MNFHVVDGSPVGGIECPHQRPSPEHVEETEAELRKWGKTYEFHAYDDARHGFFAVDRPSLSAKGLRLMDG